MASPSPVKAVYGGIGFAGKTAEEVQEILNILEKHHVTEIDTSPSHEGNEALLRDIGVSKKRLIHTKAPCLTLKAMSKQSMFDGMEKSLKDLGLDSIDLYYLHGPDPTTPIEETLKAIQELYALGKFKRFGLSNLKPEQVQEIYDIQAAASSVLPTVYSVNYNAVTRHPEATLFPLLHKLKMSFYAYSPIGGGFLAKDPAQMRAGKVDGRYGWENIVGDLYRTLYCKESILAALDEWEKIAHEAGITKVALAYRWVAHNSMLKGEHGDAIIFGASTIAQLKETLRAIEEGPLDEETARKVDAIWAKIEKEAPGDYYHDFLVNLGNP